METFEAEIKGKETYVKKKKNTNTYDKKEKTSLFIYNHSFHIDFCISML